MSWDKAYNKRDINKVLRISSQDRTRYNKYKIEKLKPRKVLRKNLISNNGVDEWNGHSNNIVSPESIGRLKRTLDKFMDEDDGWNSAVLFTQGLPWLRLTASCSFPLFSCSYVCMPTTTVIYMQSVRWWISVCKLKKTSRTQAGYS